MLPVGLEEAMLLPSRRRVCQLPAMRRRPSRCGKRVTATQAVRLPTVGPPPALPRDLDRLPYNYRPLLVLRGKFGIALLGSMLRYSVCCPCLIQN